MTSHGSLGAYRNVSVGTADPATLVLQLFDGALRFLGRARQALASGRQPDFAYAVSRAHAIIAELSNVLDREAASDAVKGLDQLYDFMLRYLTEGLAARSAAHLDHVLGLLQTLREGFEGAIADKRDGSAA
jgi:flagellar protein FliS